MLLNSSRNIAWSPSYRKCFKLTQKTPFCHQPGEHSMKIVFHAIAGLSLKRWECACWVDSRMKQCCAFRRAFSEIRWEEFFFFSFACDRTAQFFDHTMTWFARKTTVLLICQNAFSDWGRHWSGIWFGIPTFLGRWVSPSSFDLGRISLVGAACLSHISVVVDHDCPPPENHVCHNHDWPRGTASTLIHLGTRWSMLSCLQTVLAYFVFWPALRFRLFLLHLFVKFLKLIFQVRSDG